METGTQQDPPLLVVLQQCNDNEHLNPMNDYTAWKTCLQGVYDTRQIKPTALEYANAIYAVWSANLTRTIFTNVLLGITPAYNPSDVYSSVNINYPITVTIIVDTTQTIQTGNAVVQVTDDNGDPSQGSNELAINVKVGNTIIWRAVSQSGGDSIQLTTFDVRGGVQLFTNGGPQKNADGTWQGVIAITGTEVYAFDLTINNSTRTYTWDPYIYSTQ